MAAPSVLSIVRVNSTPTNATTSLSYTVTFSEDVSGVDAADFALTATGTASANIASVSAVDPSVYTVTLDTISGDGTVRLDLNNSGTGITDVATSSSITAGFTSGQVYSLDTPPRQPPR